MILFDNNAPIFYGSSMKLSCLPVTLYPALSAGKTTLRDWFELAASLGLDGADVSVVHLESLGREYLGTVRAQAEDLGLCIAMLVTYSDFTHPSARERSRQSDKLKRHIEAARELGALYMRVTAGQAHPGVGTSEGTEWAVAGLTSGLQLAHQAGVTLTYENHTRGYGWMYNDFSQPTDIFLDIVERTENTGLGILFDTANNLAHGDDPLAVLDRVKRRVNAVHLSDIRRPGEFEPVLLGTGAAPIEDMLRVLAHDGFDEWISVEEASNTGEGGFLRAVHFADQAWVNAGGSPRQGSGAISSAR